MKVVDFTAECAACLELVTSECFRLGDEVVCTEHLLLALLKSTSAEQLEIAGIERTLWVTRLEECLAAERLPAGIIVLLGRPGCQTPRVKLAIEAAMLRASAESGSVEVRDIWFGLLNDPECRTVKWLAQQGLRAVDLQRCLG
jgi:ATP-dependent Clp protease ATP-binding subunit ClpA